MPAKFPEVGEYTIATVKKVMPYGAFCSLDEYGGGEALLHVSEVSSGWVKNVRDFVKEGQKIVIVITHVIPEKGQVDISLKRVSESDRRRVLEGAKRATRAEKMLQAVSKRLGKKLADVEHDGDLLKAEFGDLYAALEALAAGQQPKAKVSKEVLTALKEIADKEVKPKAVSVRAVLALQSDAGDGLVRVQRALAILSTLSAGELKTSVKYLGSGRYFFDVEAPDYKQADKVIAKAQTLLEAAAKSDGVAFAKNSSTALHAAPIRSANAAPRAAPKPASRTPRSTARSTSTLHTVAAPSTVPLPRFERRDDCSWLSTPNPSRSPESPPRARSTALPFKHWDRATSRLPSSLARPRKPFATRFCWLGCPASVL